MNLYTNHNRSNNRSLDDPPEGSVVIRIPTTATKQWIIHSLLLILWKPTKPANCKAFILIYYSIFLYVYFRAYTYPESSKCRRRTAHIVTQIVGVPVRKAKDQKGEGTLHILYTLFQIYILREQTKVTMCTVQILIYTVQSDYRGGGKSTLNDLIIYNVKQ